METTLENKISKKIKKIILILFIVFFVICISIAAFFVLSLMPKSKNDDIITYELKNGLGINQVLEELEDKGIIKNAISYKIYVKLKNIDSFQAGSYNLSESMNAEEIINSLAYGKNVVIDTISITFIEGKRFPYYVKKIADNFNYSYDEIMATSTNKEYLESLIQKYWFIEKDILNDELYYPLEGYIFPDTYEFKKDATIEEIFDKMLYGMDKNLSTYKNEIELTNMSIHSLLTLASMVELEAVTPEDRQLLAGVFENRIKQGDSLGSDVTTYYSVKKELTEILTASDINKCTAYNTRNNIKTGQPCVKGLPVGPICSPSLSSIAGVLTPQDTKYYYFVADIHNKLYFGVTLDDHNKNISNLKKQGLWPE